MINSVSNSTGRVAVVTGSNKGIGYYIALQLGLSGLFRELVLGCRDPYRAADAVASLQAQLPEAVHVSAVPLVLGDTASHESFAAVMQENFGKVDVLINNAAMAYKGSDPTPFAQQTKPTLDINFRATLDFTQRMIPLLQRGTDARLVNQASMAGRLNQVAPALQQEFSSPALTLPRLRELVDAFECSVQEGTHQKMGWGNSNYGMSKLAVIAATKVLACQHPEISINCCCPGYCMTDMSSHRGSRHPADGAKNAVLPATMEYPPTGAYFADYQLAEW
jgi:carbonyl reductase 1